MWFKKGCLLNIYTVAPLIFLSFFNSFLLSLVRAAMTDIQIRRDGPQWFQQANTKVGVWRAIINSTIECISRQRKDLKQQTLNSKYVGSHQTTLVNTRLGLGSEMEMVCKKKSTSLLDFYSYQIIQQNIICFFREQQLSDYEKLD